MMPGSKVHDSEILQLHEIVGQSNLQNSGTPKWNKYSIGFKSYILVIYGT